MKPGLSVSSVSLRTPRLNKMLGSKLLSSVTKILLFVHVPAIPGHMTVTTFDAPFVDLVCRLIPEFSSDRSFGRGLAHSSSGGKGLAYYLLPISIICHQGCARNTVEHLYDCFQVHLSCIKSPTGLLQMSSRHLRLLHEHLIDPKNLPG